MKRTASRPTSSTTSRSVTKSPDRFDIFTGSPARSRRTSCTILTSSSACAAADRLHRRLHALDVAAMVGAPHVDHVAEAALELVAVIGDVGGEIGVAAVRLHQRPVDVVAERGRAEQRLLAILPVLDRRALRRRQAALVDVALARAATSIVAATWSSPSMSERSEKNTSWLHVERGEILADHRHHHVDRLARARSAATRSSGIWLQRAAVLARRAPRRPASGSRRDRALPGSRRCPRRAPRGSAG